MSNSVVLMFYKENLPTTQSYSCMNGECRRIILISNRKLMSIVKAGQIPVKDIPPGVTMQVVKCRGCEWTYHIYYQ